MNTPSSTSPTYAPFWWDDTPPAEAETQPLAARCDVAIVGGGYTGLLAALVLARAGRSVQVFDSGIPGAAASSRNAGIASGTTKSGYSALVEKWGAEKANAAYAEGVAARRDLRRFIEAEGIDCQYQTCGRFTGATRPRKFDAMQREAEMLNSRFDIGASMVGKADQHREIGSDFYFGGMIRPDIAALNPARFYRGLAARAGAAGSAIHGHAPVGSIARASGGGFTVTTERGSTLARDVLVCTNGYTDTTQPWLRRRLVPVASQMIATEPLPDGLMDRLLPTRRILSETKKMSHYYRTCPEGRRILFGGRLYGTQTDGAELSHARLHADLLEIFPDLADVAISHTWWGFVAFPRDMLTMYRLHDGIHYAAGYNGAGVVWARWFGIKAAYRVLGDARAQSEFRDRIVGAIPFYTGKPWFLPAVRAWYGLRDRFGF